MLEVISSDRSSRLNRVLAWPARTPQPVLIEMAGSRPATT
jgi:hypothetical protein